MKESIIAAVSLMPRDQLEILAVQAALRTQSDRLEILAGDTFLAILVGFLFGVVVAVSGFLFGLHL